MDRLKLDGLNKTQKVEMLTELLRLLVRRRKKDIKTLVDLLRRVQKKHLHEPDSDAREYCNGCSRSPYNVPQHDADCLVPAIAKALKQYGKKARP
jgi:hypothetical protein